MTLTPGSSFLINFAAAFVGAFLLMCGIIVSSHGSLSEDFVYAIIPAIPGALAWGAISHHYLFRKSGEWEYELPPVGIILLIAFAAIAGAVATFCLLPIVAMLSWAFATPP